jgi:ubiquinone/menaquinone biosynthesis C-methylase UbiE
MIEAEDQKRLIAGVFSRAAPTYEQTGVAFFSPIGRALVAAAALRPGDQVLDVGCGRGASLFPAAEAVGKAGFVTGIDLAAGMVEAASAELVQRGMTNAVVLVGDAEAPKFPTGSFDALLAGLVVFFLPDVAATFARYATLLRAGGCLALSTFAEPTDEDRSRIQNMRDALAPYLPESKPADPDAPPPPDARLRNRESLTAPLASAGFTAIEFSEFTHRVEFDNPEPYWEWNWSQGIRAMLEQIPADRLDDARTAFLTAAEAQRGPDGLITYDFRLRLTTARTPA